MTDWTIASWNVNSLAVRAPQVVDWLSNNTPTVLALQETKVPNDKFPETLWGPLGYHHYFHGQKTYNGVALLSKTPLEKIEILDIGEGQARAITGVLHNTRIVNIYVPNGATTESDKFAYKLRFLERLTAYLTPYIEQKTPIVILGDFNIAPHNIDVHEIERWAGSVLTCSEIRTVFQDLLSLGFTDTFRTHHPDESQFSWWDYRQAAFRRNMGLRIDLILASNSLMPHCTDASIDKTPRSNERPSDHTPVLATFDNA
jgi:exodeoxyribonuclease-3